MIADQRGLRKVRSAMTGGMLSIVVGKVRRRHVEKTVLCKHDEPGSAGGVRGQEGRVVRLLFEREPILLNDWVGEHFAGDALHLSLGLGFVQPVFERQLKELALAHIT